MAGAGVRAHLTLSALLLGLWAGAVQAQVQRLPRDVFDVIPPADRVKGERGGFSVWQKACRVGPIRQSRHRIVDVAVQEWAVFGFQTIDATTASDRRLPEGLVAPELNPVLPTPRIVRSAERIGTFEDSREVAATIAGYWTATPDGGSEIIEKQNRAWGGPGGDQVNWVEPWSAAFVSWLMCEAGLGETRHFQRSIGHWRYIDQAILARDGDVKDTAYVAYDVGEQPVGPGDLLCNARASSDYRTLADRRPEIGRQAPSHCDVVVKVDVAAKRILVIGGNVLQSVSLTILPATSTDGTLRPLTEADIAGARTTFAHLKLQADPVPPDALDRSPAVLALSR
jgi:hypothetical protein